MNIEVSVLQGSDVLTILAEIFVAFAGFTGMVAALGQRSEGKWRPVDVIRFRALLETSLAGLLLSVVPYGLHYAGVAETIIWGGGSAVSALWIVSILARTVLSQRQLRAVDDPDFVPGARSVLLLLSVPALVVQVLNAAGLGMPHLFIGFLVGLLYVLLLCCTMFVLLLRFVRVDVS